MPKAINDHELAEVIARKGVELRVEMGSGGIVLHAGTDAYEINFAQAEVLFETAFGRCGQ